MKERQHRQSKRSWEMQLICEALRTHLPQKPLEVLEFGAGSGFQIPFLRNFGHVTASDIHLDPILKTVEGIKTVECSIENTSFTQEQFDLIFSNHVIEHLENPQAAFTELKRIGKPDCVYAFSVPTNVWLMLSVPAQYWSRVQRLRTGRSGKTAVAEPSIAPQNTRSSFWERFLPRGHGVEERFGRCYHQFKMSTWEKFFARHEFTICKVQPLLLYGPSECPVIPTMPAAGRLCSSVLFILRQSKEGVPL